MKDPQDFHCASTHAVRQNVGRAGNHQFPRVRHPAGAARRWIVGQYPNGFPDLLGYFTRRRRIIFGYVFSDCLEIIRRLLQPANSHAGGSLS